MSPTSALEESITAKLTEQEQRLQAQMDQLAQARYEADMATFRAHATGVVRESAPALAGAFGEDAVDIIRQRYETLAEAQRHRGEKVNLPPIEDVVRDMERETLDFATRLKEIPAVRALFGQPRKIPGRLPYASKRPRRIGPHSQNRNRYRRSGGRRPLRSPGPEALPGLNPRRGMETS